MERISSVRAVGLLCVVVAARLLLAGPGVVLINGAGATFPYPIYSKWFDAYHELFPNLEFNYQSIGSGGGVKQVIEGTVDFGGSDMPMTDAQMAEFQAK